MREPRSPHCSGCCSFCCAAAVGESGGMVVLCVISIEALPTPASTEQRTQEWGLVAWHPPPCFTSIDLSQASGCPSFPVLGLLQRIYLLLFRFTFSVLLIKWILDVPKLYFLNSLRGRKEERGYDLPKVRPFPLSPVQLLAILELHVFNKSYSVQK